MVIAGLLEDAGKMPPGFIYTAWIWPVALFGSISGLRASRAGAIILLPVAMLFLSIIAFMPRNAGENISAMGMLEVQIAFFLMGGGILIGSLQVLKDWKERPII